MPTNSMPNLSRSDVKHSVIALMRAFSGVMNHAPGSGRLIDESEFDGWIPGER